MLAGLSLAAAIPFLPLAADGMEAVPSASSFPEMVLRKGQTLDEWPFSIDEGKLICIRYAGQRFVFFAEILPEDEADGMKAPRMAAVTANPFSLFGTHDSRDLYAPWVSLETLVTRLAPYERMGWKLCDSAGITPQSDEL